MAMSPEAEKARALHKEGLRISEVAKKLGRRPSVVHRWVNEHAAAKHRRDELARQRAKKDQRLCSTPSS